MVLRQQKAFPRRHTAQGDVEWNNVTEPYAAKEEMLSSKYKQYSKQKLQPGTATGKTHLYSLYL